MVGSLAGRRLWSRLWPARWDGAGIVALLFALLLGPLGAAGLFRSTPSHWHAPASALAFVAGGLLGPLVEEWAFRGVLWRASIWVTGPWRWTPAVAMGFTALLFGLWHIPFQHDARVATEVVFANLGFGLCLGFARFRLDALGPGAIVHALGNAFFLLTV